MKRIVLLVLVSLFCTSVFSQKKKKSSKNAMSSVVLAKVDNLSTEIIKDNFYLVINNKALKDTMFLKKINVNKKPMDCKITPFAAKGMPLYLVTWTEKSNTQTAVKKEDILETYSEICEITSKTRVLSNIQTNKKSTEQVFLDKKRTVSETQDHNRNEGFVLTLTTEGDVVLKTKTQEFKKIFDSKTMKFVDSKRK